MAIISKDDFLFLQSIGVPYEGDIAGVGTVECDLFVTSSSRPPSGATSQGTFLSVNYLATVMPDNEPLITDEELFQRIVSLNRSGDYEVWDANAGIPVNMGKKITECNIQVHDNNLSIYVKGENGNSYSYSSQNGLDAYLDKLNSSKSLGRVGYDGMGAIFNYGKYRYDMPYNKKAKIKPMTGMKKATKQRFAYKIQKLVKRHRGVRIPTSLIKNTGVPGALRIGGKLLGAFSGILVAVDALNEGSFRVSHALDGLAIVVCFAGPYGWIVGLSYFLVDIGVYLVTDRSIGSYANEWFHNNGWLKNGEILNLDPVLT